MRTKVTLLILFVAMVFGCKEKTEKVSQEPTKVAIEKPKTIPSEMVKIAKFAGVLLSDSVDITSQIGFKSVASNGRIDTVDMANAVKLYKTWFRSGKGDLYPIFEVKGSEDVVITTANKGYGGNIRGTFLINRTSLQIKKVAFEHIAESEGYGAAIANSSFEDQFVGATINFNSNPFGLNQNGKNIIKGIKSIDGISGATTTSRLTIQMVNDELNNYKTYFLDSKKE